MSSSKKNWHVEGFCGSSFCLRPPSLLGFGLGWSCTFVGSESGQIQSVKLLQNMVSKRTQHPPHPPTPATHCLYTLYIDTRKGEEGWESWTREKVRGATAHKAGAKIPTWLSVSPVYRDGWFIKIHHETIMHSIHRVHQFYYQEIGCVVASE